jgi:trimeric autotransporter adhesin
MAKEFLFRVLSASQLGCWLHLPLVALLGASALHAAATQGGHVQFGGQPVPGAIVRATRDSTTHTTVTDQQGDYSLPDLSEGEWTIQVTMRGFEPIERKVKVAADGPPEIWTLSMSPLTAILGDYPPPQQSAAVASTAQAVSPTPANAAPTAPGASGSNKPEPLAKEQPPDLASAADDGLLINGSVNNGAALPFALPRAFGNDRPGSSALYSGNLGFTFDNSAFDARAFSLTGQDTPKPDYNHFTGLATFGGPLKIPHLLRRKGPDVILNYQWTRNRTANTLPSLMPTLDQRSGDFFGPTNATIYDPTTSQPFAGNVIPASRLSPQALSLLNLYPLPNFAEGTGYNYQIPVTGATHQDSWQSRVNENFNRKNQVYGSFSGQSTRSDAGSIFDFLDRTDSLGLNANAAWRYTFTTHLSAVLSYQFSRFSQRVTPEFDDRENISGEAGITGNDQTSVNWGPPTLTFASGITSLTDAQYSLTHNQTSSVGSTWLWIHGRHYLTMGGDFRRQQFNLLSEQNPRGSFGFTGASTSDASVPGVGNDFAGFLLGIPDTSQIAYGNADKYFRDSLYDAYFTDDLRISSGLTVNAGLRWDYGSPMSELYGRLANLAIAPGFTSAAPVVGSSLIHPDRLGFEPRIAIAWRPFADSSMVVRAGYGIYDNTSVYLPIVTNMAQQPPLSKNLSVQNTLDNPLTLADGFMSSATLTNTYAVDPNLRVGYAQNWNFSIQRDLPGSLTMTALYFGAKGTRGLQEFYPSTYPAEAVNPCPLCPVGFAYVASNGNSTRESAQIQLRRRLHNGLTATLQYVFSKSIDDASLGGGSNQSGYVVAQNWLNLDAERGLSNFDQRHLLSLTAQYSTGMGRSGAALLSGWRGALTKDWTVLSQITAGSGLPETPVYYAAVNGTGFTGSIRPDYTGAPLYDAPTGFFLNPAAYVPPAPDEWGNAGRNSITGPSQFTWNASLGRTFRLKGRMNFDLRVDSTNALNHATFTSWNVITTSPQFGLPAAANNMRSIQTTLRFHF